MSTKTLDRKFLGGKNAFIEVAKSKGSYLIDEEGNKYIDFLMGWCVGNLGWGNEIIERAVEHSRKVDYVYPNFTYRPWTELAELLASITPGKLKKSYRTTGGTESIETAMQLSMNYTKRYKFMSIEGSYHGNSIGTLSIGSSANRKQYKNLLPNCFKIKPPLNEAALEKIEARLLKKDIAAFIMEPIICNLGVLIPEKNFMIGLQELCNKYGTLLVMDEVATGFGRTGKLFASEHYGITPDVMCLSKAMSSGYSGIGATITTEEIADAVADIFNMYSTYGWHPVSVDAALANIHYIVDNQENLLTHVAGTSAIFRSRLMHMEFETKQKVNVAGLAIAVNVDDSYYAENIKENCLKKGLIISSEGSTLLMFPALTIEKEVVQKGLDILEQCI